MNCTKIEWVKSPDGSQGYTWNPVTGCRHGCSYCYARRIAMRFEGHFDPTFHPDRMNDPVKRKKPTGIFVCSMADLLGAWVPESWIRSVIDTMERTPQHRYYLLTKNPERYSEFDWPRNAWLGATATDQKSFDRACDAFAVGMPLGDTKRVRFVSCEPLLGPINPTKTIWPADWLIIGAMTGPGSARHKPEPIWIESLILRAQDWGIRIFVKDNLPWPGKLQELP